MDVLLQPVMSIAFKNQMQENLFQLKMTDGKIKTSLFLQMGNHTTFLVIQMELISRTISPSIKYRIMIQMWTISVLLVLYRSRMCSLSLVDPSIVWWNAVQLSDNEDPDPFYSLDIVMDPWQLFIIIIGIVNYPVGVLYVIGF